LKVLDLAGIPETKEVKGIGLDIGAGSGLSTVSLTERGFPGIGIDASFGMLKQGLVENRMLDAV
jgi:2-polyprenyl-3-methyl-5-hydroxy-6-metoxy-1,4-benzoquinol methylase